MLIPWHRFLKVGLKQVFSGSCFEVQDEFDLSDPKQLVDFVVIRRGDLDLPAPDPARLPDGLQDLQDHNLISYKSMNEAFDRFALNELVGHAVAYSKLQAKGDWKAFSDQLGLIAVSTRKPTTEVIAALMHQTAAEDVYQIDCAGWQIICVVINQAPPEDRNWLWELMRGDRSRWKNGTIATILKEIERILKNMVVISPVNVAFETQLIESWLEDLPAEKRLIGLDLKNTAEGKELIEQGMEQGEEKIIIKLAKSRFPKMTQKQEEQIRALSSSELEKFAVAFLGFAELKDLSNWLG